ncbi:TniQ family protein [Nostoc sp.]
MLPPAEVGMKLEPIRLCAACYTESRRRYRHKLHLLSECPNCGARFKIPALWIDGHCQRCIMRFTEMENYQKFVEV